MPHKPREPSPIWGCFFLEEEDEAAVAFGVGGAGPAGYTRERLEALGDGCFHLGHGAGGGRVDVGGGAVDAVHDEGAGVHAGLGGGDEVEVVGAACPGRVDADSGLACIVLHGG